MAGWCWVRSSGAAEWRYSLSVGASVAGRPGGMAGFPQRGELLGGLGALSGRRWEGRRRAGPDVVRTRRRPTARRARSVGDVLHGRDDERARLATLLDDARGGRAGTLLLHGEPGVGKSALLEDLVANAGDDVRVLRTQGVESEAPLPFAALHRLLRPVLGILDRLPAPQARALRAAFGEADDVAVEPFLAALATLSMLTEAAEDATGAVRHRRRAVARPGHRRRGAGRRRGGWAPTGSPSCSPPATARATRSHPTASPPSRSRR